jgi:WD40 repeat protein
MAVGILHSVLVADGRFLFWLHALHRALESSQIMYESQELKPLLRVAWNPHDDRYLATIIAGKPSVVIIDSRSAARPVVELNQHSGSVNSISWSPHSKFHICSAAEDRTAIVYDIADIAGIDGVATGMNARHANRVTSSVFFRSQTPINQVRWSPNQENCIALCDEEAAHVVQL